MTCQLLRLASQPHSPVPTRFHSASPPFLITTPTSSSSKGFSPTLTLAGLIVPVYLGTSSDLRTSTNSIQRTQSKHRRTAPIANS
ncbi:hypothetical protein PGT21_007322 [Puccinia graminis f. sp. tritici]|uniref:Uncharacterized protein n=1 Tax=Puccinia graminis f. sp. tritici TaxID=56615 RepID=A0A5B0RC53_PUCGR|nr:hypothetical protein PGT21_007322 [Puccinia graminis f. sp. tritici]KAA1122939.1 hypothetical protein PGTUg99_004261 [Puccinia graminis f. sp. tritici]